MYICMCTYTWKNSHTHKYIHTYPYEYKDCRSPSTYVYMYVCIYMKTLSHTHKYIHTYPYEYNDCRSPSTYVYMYVCIYMKNFTHTHINTYIHTHMNTMIAAAHLPHSNHCWEGLYVCVCICMCVLAPLCWLTWCIHICMYICMHAKNCSHRDRFHGVDSRRRNEDIQSGDDSVSVWFHPSLFHDDVCTTASTKTSHPNLCMYMCM
jgi:hypothetical protein